MGVDGDENRRNMVRGEGWNKNGSGSFWGDVETEHSGNSQEYIRVTLAKS